MSFWHSTIDFDEWRLGIAPHIIVDHRRIPDHGFLAFKDRIQGNSALPPHIIPHLHLRFPLQHIPIHHA